MTQPQAEERQQPPETDEARNSLSLSLWRAHGPGLKSRWYRFGTRSPELRECLLIPSRPFCGDSLERPREAPADGGGTRELLSAVPAGRCRCRCRSPGCPERRLPPRTCKPGSRGTARTLDPTRACRRNDVGLGGSVTRAGGASGRIEGKKAAV